MPIIKIEIWKDIPGLEGYYQACASGKIRSVTRNVTCRNGISKPINGRELLPINNGRGYLGISVSVKGKIRRVYIHQLVAKTFVSNPNGYSEINHIDGNKSNNAASNLEYCTRSENNLHAYKTGLKIPYDRSGKKNPRYIDGRRCGG